MEIEEWEKIVSDFDALCEEFPTNLHPASGEVRLPLP